MYYLNFPEPDSEMAKATVTLLNLRSDRRKGPVGIAPLTLPVWNLSPREYSDRQHGVLMTCLSLFVPILVTKPKDSN